MPLGKLDVGGVVRGYVLASNRSPVGMDANILFNGDNRYKVTQTGAAEFNLPRLFDGALEPSYLLNGVSSSDPTKIVIEGLPKMHTQAGAWVGWTTRFWHPKKFKIEGYDAYDANKDGIEDGWITIADYSATDYTGEDFMTKVPGGAYTELIYTFFSASGSPTTVVGGNTLPRGGLSELFFIHPEAARPYSGLLPSSMWEVNSNVGIGTKTPQSALQVAGYIQFALTSVAPPPTDCDAITERGRMKVDNVNAKVYLCVDASWKILVLQ
jgi:hypothetical protein